MIWACSTHEKDHKSVTNFGRNKFKTLLEELGVDGRIILKGI
jgi:hypothetical protein